MSIGLRSITRRSHLPSLAGLTFTIVSLVAGPALAQNTSVHGSTARDADGCSVVTIVVRDPTNVVRDVHLKVATTTHVEKGGTTAETATGDPQPAHWTNPTFPAGGGGGAIHPHNADGGLAGAPLPNEVNWTVDWTGGAGTYTIKHCNDPTQVSKEQITLTKNGGEGWSKKAGNEESIKYNVPE